MLVQERAGCLARINGLYSRLTEAERLVADYIRGQKEVIYQTITHVVKASGASYGSVDRFCKKLGYSGFQDLKIRLAEDLAARKVSEGGATSEDFVEWEAIQAKRDIDNTVQLISRDALRRAAQAIVRASFILVAGLSGSAGTAMGFDYRLGRFGLKSACYTDNHLQRHRAAALSERDLAVLFSFSGSTKEILATGKIARKTKATVISVTNSIESPVAELADETLISGIVNDPLGAEIAPKVAVEFVISLLFGLIEEYMEGSREMLSRTFYATADRQL